MPELPEVETTLQAIKLFENETLSSIKIHNPNLRWPIDRNINKKISNKKIHKIFRRAKYLIFDLSNYYLIIHLGMSGTLRIMNTADNYFKKHDHVELIFKSKKLIYNDPRRFGSIHITKSYQDHSLISIGFYLLELCEKFSVENDPNNDIYYHLSYSLDIKKGVASVSKCNPLQNSSEDYAATAT